MKQDFLKCFNVADMIFILPIYTAGEKIDNKISNVSLSKSLNKKYKNKIIQPATDNIKFFKDLYKIISSGDNIIFLGAGNSSKIANAFSEFLRNHEI